MVTISSAAAETFVLKECMVAINSAAAETFVLKECMVAINSAVAEIFVLKECMIAINPAAEMFRLKAVIAAVITATMGSVVATKGTGCTGITG